VIVIVDDKIKSTKRCGLSTVIIPVHGSCLLGDCIYNLDSLMSVIPLLVFHVCAYDENCTRCTAHTQNNQMKVLNSRFRNYGTSRCQYTFPRPVKFEVITAVTLKVSSPWAVAPCSRANIYQH